MITKTTMVVIFNSQNSHLLTLFLPTEEVFQVNGLNRPVANLPVVDFHSAERNAERNANTKATEYVTFDFSCPFRKVWTSLSISDTDFFVFSRQNSWKLRQTSCIENREGFAVHSSTWPSGAKGEWRCSSWLAISRHVKKYDFFSRVLVQLFSGPDILLVSYRVKHSKRNSFLRAPIYYSLFNKNLFNRSAARATLLFSLCFFPPYEKLSETHKKSSWTVNNLLEVLVCSIA